MAGPVEAKTTETLDAAFAQTLIGQVVNRGSPPSFSDSPISPFAFEMIMALKATCQELAAEVDRLRAEIAS